MANPMLRIWRNNILVEERHLPQDANVKIEKSTTDGNDYYDLRLASPIFDDPGTADSEREARTPIIHAHAPGDPVGPDPELNPVEAESVKDQEPPPLEVPGDESAPAEVAPVAAQKTAMRSASSEKAAPATETKDTAAAKKAVKK